MNMKLQTSLFLVFQLYICIITAQFIAISRPKNGVDSFNLPPWMCSNPQYSCNSFNAVGQLPSCSCACSIPMATFTFVNNRWTCMVNQQARDHIQQGCQSKSSLVGEKSDGRIPTLNFGDARETGMNYWLWQYWTCAMRQDSSSYISCDGTRRNFTQQYSNIFPRLFTMTRASPNARYFLRVNSGVTGSNLLQGKILNLLIDCSTSPILNQGIHAGVCVTLKLQGTESCPVQAPTSSASSSPTLLTKTMLITKSTASSPQPNTSDINKTQMTSH